MMKLIIALALVAGVLLQVTVAESNPEVASAESGETSVVSSSTSSEESDSSESSESDTKSSESDSSESDESDSAEDNASYKPLPPKPRCKKPNEVYEICPASCPFRTCGIDDRAISCSAPPKPGDPKCPKPRCRCRPGLYRDRNGNCVRWEKCDTKLKCKKPNDAFEFCPPRCPFRTCGIDDRVVRCAAPPKPGDPNCPKDRCRCKSGFFRDRNGNCVRWEQCDTKCTGPNEIYDPCDNPCPARRCDFDPTVVRCKAPPEVGDEECLIGCRCKDGYLRNDKNICVAKDQCPKKCGANEVYDPCPDCSPQTCSTVGERFNCPMIPSNTSDPRCKGACRCQKGYARDDNNVCVLIKNCPKTCGTNEIYDPCPDCSPQTCSTVNQTFNCPLIPSDPSDPQCKGACRCQKGYARDNNNDCVPEEYCSKCRGSNEVYDSCPGCSPQTCETKNTTFFCPRLKCNGACRCKRGYFRNKIGECISGENCDKCTGGHEYWSCGSACDNRCDSKYGQDNCNIINIVCNKMCYCEKDYARAANGTCILKKDCPKQCPKNERYVQCPDNVCGPKTCSAAGFPSPPCSITNDDDSCPGKPGCICNEGYLRNNKGVCVPNNECPSCGGDKNATIGCGVNCGRLCSNYKQKNVACILVCYSDACDCRKDYVYDSNTKQCVLPKDCTPVCKNNEVYSTCINGGCQKKKCTDLNKPKICVHPKECIVGCLCADGYLRDKNGTCVPIDKCDAPKPVCKENEEFSKCGLDGCSKRYCSDLELPPLCRDTFTCDPGCECKDGYLRASTSNDTCVPVDECPPVSCNGDQNARPGCGVHCGNRCSDYKNAERIACPAICMVDGCDCKEGFVFDDNTKLCVKPEECTPTCAANEQYSNCSNGLCRVQQCSEKGKAKPCPPMVPGSCTPGCVCPEKYLRSKNGTCVPEDQCDVPPVDPIDPTCPKNEIYVQCAETMCQPLTCKEAGFPMPCPILGPDGQCPGKPRCICTSGYLRNNDGVCVPIKKCPSTCSADEEFSPCSNQICRVQDCTERGKPKRCPGACPPGRPCPPMVPIPCVAGCICPENYLRNKNGKCIPEDQCEPSEQECPKNEILVDCPQALCRPATCAQAGLPVACPRYAKCPGKPGCVCTEGYLRDSNGVCVPDKECPSCNGDENAVPGCGVNCGKRCSDYNSTEGVACIDICYPNGCDCKEGFVFDDQTNLCVKPEQCSPKCGVNEQYTDCANGLCRIQKCSDKGKKPPPCPPMEPGSCRPGCICPENYLRSQNGTCVPEDQCDVPTDSCGGDENAVPGCGINCGRLCSNYKSKRKPLCPMICKLDGCDCKEGYVYDGNRKKCVLPEKCTPTCGINEEFSECSNGLCRVQDCSQKGKQQPCPPMVPGSCTAGCICPEKFLRSKNGTCVSEDQCDVPAEPTCPTNEVYSECPDSSCQPETCAQAGFPVACPGVGPDGQCPGKPRCVCSGGTYRNSDGVCIPKNECPSCGGDENAIPGCGVNCGRLCSNYNNTRKPICPLFCNLNGCDCKKGYVLDSNTNKCVLPENCTPTCGINEEFSDCSNGLCRVQQCSDKGKDRPCPPMVPGSCTPGCVCPENYLRAQNGTCVPDDQCDVPPACPEGETYDKCPPPKCDGEYCPKTRNDPQTCPYPDNDSSKCSTPRCVCGFNEHRDRKTGKCIATSDCPKFKCGPNEQFYDCSPSCPGDSCIDYLNNATCPKFKIGIVVPCKLGCRCEKGYYRNSRNVCVPGPVCKTQACGVNEVLSNCSNGLCRAQVCADKGKLMRCAPLRPGLCTKGCVCKDKYLKSKNGTCVPEDQCDDKSCPEGETFSNCPPPKCDGEYCPRTRNDPQTCSYPNNDSTKCGKPRCVCGFNSHRDRKTGKCIATSQCPEFACDGPNESFNSCVPTCPGETCTDYLNNATCPRFRIGIVVPCKLGCRCDKGYYRNSNNICIQGPKCKGSTTVPPKTDTCDAEAQQKALRRGNTALNGKFLYQVMKINPDKSVFVSAFSAFIPMAQLFLYSNGSTFTQLASLLNVPNKADIRCGFPGLLGSVKATNGTVLNVAAKIYVYNKGKLSKQLEDDSQNVFNAKAETVDFNDGAKTCEIINKWVSDATDGKITDLVNADSFDPNTVLALVNAILFKGLWKYKFDSKNTKPRDFYVGNNKTIQVPTMYQKGNFRYGELSDPGVQILEMPCKDENITIMVVLPNQKDGVLAVAEKMQDPDVFDTMLNSLSSQSVNVYLPKINIETSTDVKEVLEAIGVKALFDPSEAELKGMIDPDADLYVSKAVQKALVEMDEEGAVAAAATAVTVTKMSAVIEPETYTFDADHPYIFCINLRGMPLFCGAFYG